MGSSKRAWDIRDGEPAKAYAVFLLYRSMGVGRKLAEVIKQTGATERTVHKLAAMFQWRARAEAFDVWSLRQRSGAAEKRVLREAELEARTVSDLVHMTRVLVRRTLREVNRNKEQKLTPQSAATLGDIVVKLSRLARGEPTDRRENIARSARERVGEKLDRVARTLADQIKGQGSKTEEVKPDGTQVH